MHFCGANLRRFPIAIGVIGAAGWGTLATPATAAEPPSVAQGMTDEGLKAYASGRYTEADEKLSRALDLVGVPTLALYAARANVRLNHWVRASELYLLASRLTAASTADINLLQAQHEAGKERSELLLRMPRLTIALNGEDLDTVEVTLDSEPVPKALLGANQLVDPGHHVICATRDGQLVTGEIDVFEYQHKTTTLHFAHREPRDSLSQTLPSIATSTDGTNAKAPSSLPQRPSSSMTTPSAPPAAASSEERLFGTDASTSLSRDSTERGQDSVSTLRTLGWVGVGLGGAGLLVGVTAGMMAVSARSDLSNSRTCVGNSCSSDSASEVERYNQLRNWSTAGFVLGGLFGAAGTTLLLVDSGRQHEGTGRGTRQATRRDAYVGLVLGPTSAVIAGQF